MSSHVENIVAYLETLSRHKELIAQAYSNRGVLTINSQNERAVRVLQEKRALVPSRPDEYRLSATLTRHLDEVFQRQQMYAVGANLGDLVKRLPLLIDEYKNAFFAGRTEDADMYFDDFAQGVFELRESVESDLLRLRTLADTRFGNVSTIDEKMRQNNFYIARAKLIGSAVDILAHHAPFLELADEPYLHDMFETYRELILANMPVWRSTVLDIDEVLHQYLYKLRSVAPRAQRLRTLASFLHKNPHYVPPEADEIAELPGWSTRYKGLRVQTYPDLSVSATSEALVELALTIKSADFTAQKERAVGVYVKDSAPAPIAINPKVAQQAIHLYNTCARSVTTPLSARTWLSEKHQAGSFESLCADGWLLYLAHTLQVRPGRGIAYNRIERPPAFARSGNIIVEDIQAWKLV